MIIKEITLKSKTPEQVSTEIMYEIASARVDGLELIRINILKGIGFDVGISDKKLNQAIIHTLKDMKQDGRIQFYATAKNFEESATEAVFLQNKYPDMLSSQPASTDGEVFIYLKL